MTSHRRSESGFTLVEMLIAMAVMSLVIVAFYALITTLVRQWASMQGQMEVQQQPRVAAGRIMAEIRQSRDFVIGSGGNSLGLVKATVLTADVAAGATTFSVEDASALAAARPVVLVNVTSFEQATVSSISGTTVTISAGLSVAHKQGELVRRAQSTLAASSSSGATTVSVASGSTFATGDFVAVGNEGPLTVSNVSGSTLTITPALASAHSSGEVVQPLGAIFTLAGTRVTRNGTILSAAASSGATSVSVVLGSVFAAGDIVAVGSEAPVTVSSISGNTLTITPALTSAHSSGEVVATVLADVTNPPSLQLFSVVQSTLSSSAAVGAKSLCVASATGFNANDRVQVDRETYDTTTGLVTQPDRANITSIGGGCLTVDWGLNASRAVGTIVRVNAISVNLMTSQVNANQQTQQVNVTSKATPRN